MHLTTRTVNGRKGALRAVSFPLLSRNKRVCARPGRIGGSMSSVWCAQCAASAQDMEALAYLP